MSIQFRTSSNAIEARRAREAIRADPLAAGIGALSIKHFHQCGVVAIAPDLARRERLVDLLDPVTRQTDLQHAEFSARKSMDPR
jgi:hypothetical protein